MKKPSVFCLISRQPLRSRWRRTLRPRWRHHRRRRCAGACSTTGAGGRPAGGDLVVVAEIGHELGGSFMMALSAQIPVRSMPSAVSRTAKYLEALTASIVPFAVGKVLDEGLRSVDLGGVAVIEHAEAPDAALPQLSRRSRREAHETLIFSPSLVSSASLLSGVELLSDVQQNAILGCPDGKR